MDINFCFSYILFHLSGQKHLTSSNKSIWCSLLVHHTPAYIIRTHNTHPWKEISNVIDWKESLATDYGLATIGNRCVCVFCKFNGVCPVWEFLYVWDYVHTLRTGPVQDEEAPLWKILTVPMRVDRIQICLWETKQALVSACKFAFVCMCKWKRWSMTFNTRKTLEVKTV